MDKIKILAILALVCLFSFRIWQTTGCRQFKGFRFNPLAIIIGVEAGVSSDKGVDRAISRFFHNKLSVGTYEILASFAATVNPNFLLQLIGPVGVVIAVFNLQILVHTRRKLQLTSLLIIAISAILAMFIINPKTSLYILAISWYAFILSSSLTFVRNKLLFVTFIFLVIFTFWYFTFTWQLTAFCNEIFFN